MRVLIIGGGLGGLCLAQGLQKADIEVQVFEKQTSPTENLAGYGIHINRHGRYALRSCLSLASWTRLQGLFSPAGARVFFRDTGLRVLAMRDDAEISGRLEREAERSGVGRIELRDVLLEGLVAGGNGSGGSVVRWGETFERYEVRSDGGVRAYFADGTVEDGDLLVGADGPKSRVREQYLPEIRRLDLEISTIAGRCVLDDSLRKLVPPEVTDGSLNNIVPFGKGWMFVSAWRSVRSDRYSDGPASPENYLVWAYVVHKDDKVEGLRKLDGRELQELVLDSTRGWSPELRGVIEASDPAGVQHIALKSMPALPAWDASAVTLLGDAIHNMTPLAGIGANTALRDAEVLTRFLVDVQAGRMGLVDAVGGYEAEMRGYANEALKLSTRNAEAASSGGGLQRAFFRGLLRCAGESKVVMRNTLGAAVAKGHQ